MKSTFHYKLSKGTRIIVLSFACFFMVLSIFDRFEEKEEIIYEGEFVTETEKDFLEIPNIIPRTSLQKFSKSLRLEFTAFFGSLTCTSVILLCPNLVRIWNPEVHKLSLAAFLRHILFAQAP